MDWMSGLSRRACSRVLRVVLLPCKRNCQMKHQCTRRTHQLFCCACSPWPGCSVENTTDHSLVLINACQGLLLVAMVRDLKSATASIQWVMQAQLLHPTSSNYWTIVRNFLAATQLPCGCMIEISLTSWFFAVAYFWVLTPIEKRRVAASCTRTAASCQKWEHQPMSKQEHNRCHIIEVIAPEEHSASMSEAPVVDIHWSEPRGSVSSTESGSTFSPLG